MACWNPGMAKVNFIHAENRWKISQTKLLRKTGWFHRLLLAQNRIAKCFFHFRCSDSRVQTLGFAILKGLFG